MEIFIQIWILATFMRMSNWDYQVAHMILKKIKNVKVKDNRIIVKMKFVEVSNHLRTDEVIKYMQIVHM